jgi:hypothetical protein
MLLRKMLSVMEKTEEVSLDFVLMEIQELKFSKSQVNNQNISQRRRLRERRDKLLLLYVVMW